MADLTYNVRVNTSDAQRSISTLKTALGGLAAAFSIREIVRFGDSITGLQNKLRTIAKDSIEAGKQFAAIAEIARNNRTPLEATGDLFFKIARSLNTLGISQREAATLTDSISKGLTLSGASAEGAASAIYQLGQAFGANVLRGEELNAVLENAPVLADILAESLGVSVGQLRKLGEQGVITGEKVAQAFIQANGKLTESFGKTVPTIAQSLTNVRTNAAVFFEQFERNTGLFQKLADGIKSFGDAINTLAVFFNKNIEGITTLVKVLGSLYAAYILLGRGVGTVTGVANGIAAAFSRTGGVMSSLTTAVKGIGAGFVGFFNNLLRGIGVLQSTYGGLTSIGFAVLSLGRSLLRLGGILAVLYAVAEGVDWLGKKLFDFSVKDFVGGKLEELGKWLGIIDEEQQKLAESTNKATNALSNQKGKVEEVVTATAKQVYEVQKLKEAYNQVNESQLKGLQVQEALIGLSDYQKTIANELLAVEENYVNQRRKLQEEISELSLSQDKQERAKIPLLRAALEELEKARDKQSQAVLRQVQANEKVLRTYNLSEFALRQQTQLEEDLAKVENDRAKLGMSEIEKKYYDIEKAAEASARAAIRAEEARRGEELSTEEANKYYAAALKGTERLKKAHEELYRQSRTFASGWDKAFREYVDDATNAARQAERLFQKLTSGLEDLIVDFVKTGKFEFKDFIASMAEEILRSNIRSLFAGIFTSMNDAVANQESGIMGTIGKLLGFTGGSGGAARGQSASTPMYVYDVSGGGGGGAFGGVRPGYLPGDNPLIAGGGIGGGSQGGGFFGSLGNIASGIGNVFGGVAKSVGNVIGGITNTVGSIARTVGNIFTGGGSSSGGSFLGSVAKGIGDLFGGWFATGGTIPAGRFGIVGERGPEYVSGPATVTPMMGTNVTYNINAVDAASFKALIARDPAFIHSVAMMGAQTVPGRR